MACQRWLRACSPEASQRPPRPFTIRQVQPARLLLLDEPCAAIDPPSRTELLKVMGQLRDAGLTLLVSSHDWGSDLDAYDRVLVLDRCLLAEGTPAEVRHALGDLRVGNHCCG